MDEILKQLNEQQDFVKQEYLKALREEAITGFKSTAIDTLEIPEDLKKVIVQSFEAGWDCSMAAVNEALDSTLKPEVMEEYAKGIMGMLNS